MPFADGSVAGSIVLCDRGNPAGRADSGFNVLQGDGEGMLLANVGHQDLFTDLHWLPTIMLDDGTWEGEAQPGTAIRAFVAGHTGVTATFTTGTAAEQTPDIMTTFSSRGPLGDWIKPDVTAPGIEILAGRSPQPWPGAIPSGPPGDLFMAIAGTSMSSPHAAGVSALVKAAHPDVDARPDQVGADDVVDPGRPQAGRRDAGRPVQHRAPDRSGPTGRHGRRSRST